MLQKGQIAILIVAVIKFPPNVKFPKNLQPEEYK